MVRKLLAPGYDLGGSRLQGVGAPTQATDAAPRGFVEALGVSVLAYGAAGDGTTDDTAAISAALASGRTVTLPAGKTFLVSQILVTGLSDFTLIGYGASIVGSANASSVVQVTGGSRINLLGLRIAHANATVRNDTGFGLFVDGSTDVSVRDCTISATASAGMYLDGVTRGSVEACTVRDTLADGIHVTAASSQITVTGNRTTTTGDDGIAVVSYASDTGRCQDVTITGNTVFQSKARGISVVGGSNVAITGNEVRSTKYAAIIIAQETSFSTRGVSGVLVSGNTVADANTYDSPAFQHPSILISAGSGTELVSGIHITGNQILGGGYRMLDVDGYSGGLIRGLTISGNQMLGPNSAGAGIEVARAADVQIIGNSVARTRGSGVYVGYTCDQVQVVDNIVHLPNQGNTTGVYGVYNGAMTGRTSWNSIFPDVTKADLDSDSTATDQSGYAQTLGSIGANQGVFFAGGRAVVLTGENAALAMAQDGQIRWTTDGNAGGGTVDTGLARDSAGVVKTTDGASGVGSLHVTGNLSVDGVGRTIFVRKTADETVNNSSALQDDNHLVAAVAASATYIVEAFVIYDAATAADLKLAFTGPSGATLDWTSTALGASATGGTGTLTVSASTIGDGSALPLGGVGAGTKVVAQIRGLLVVVGTAGNLTTRWAQNTAGATDAIVRTGSWMRLTRVA